MTAVTLKNVDTALGQRYAGIQINVNGVPTNVAVFVEEPSVEEYPEKVYPSIAIKFMGLEIDETFRESDDVQQEEISYDPDPSPPVRTMRQRGEPFRLIYSIDTWHKIRVGESRDLLKSVIVEKTPPRGYMPVVDVNSGTEDVWVTWEGSMATLDERLADVVIYHKSLTIAVAVTLLTDPASEDYKVVTEGIWDVYYKGTPDVKDIRMITTEDGDEGV